MKKKSYLIQVTVTLVVSIGAFVAVLLLHWGPILGLDLQGGASVVYKPSKVVSQAVLDQTISIIRNRVDALGVAEPNIARQGQDIVVQLPGLKDPQKALAIIGQTAQLQFRIAQCAVPNFTKAPPSLKIDPKSIPLTCPTTQNGYALLAYAPNTNVNQVQANRVALLAEYSGKQVTQRFILSPTLLSGSAIKSAVAGVNPNTGQWLVNFTLTSKASPIFDQIATTYYQRNLGIVLDGVIESAPTLNAKSFGGQGQISGSFTQSQADNLALVLRYGALPVQLRQQTVQTVSATLGKDSLRAGVIAGLAGLLAVMLYTILYYRALGIVVVLGLGSTAALLWAIVSYLGHSYQLSLDLSGVTGIIVSIGVTVDSYVVFFERLKDEVRAGQSIRYSVGKGFEKAFRTIVAADLVSLIGATILYLFSIGPVRGFAFFLGLSTLLDIGSAWVFTRPLVILLGSSKTVTQARWLGMARGLAVEGDGESMTGSTPRSGGILKPSKA